MPAGATDLLSSLYRHETRIILLFIYSFILFPALHPLSFDDVMVFPCGKESARLGLPPPPASG